VVLAPLRGDLQGAGEQFLGHRRDAAVVVRQRHGGPRLELQDPAVAGAEPGTDRPGHQGEQQRADAQPGPRGAGESARGRCGRFRRAQRRGRVRLRQRRGVRRVEVRVVGTPGALTGRGVHPSYLVLVRNSGAGAVAPRPTLELTWVPTRVPAPLPTDPLTEPLIEAVGGGGGDCGPTGAPARAVKRSEERRAGKE